MRSLPMIEVHREEENCVRRVPMFSGLTPAQQDMVATLARPTLLARGERLHGAGERSGWLSVVHSGQIKLLRTMPGGRQRLLRVVGPGETLGEHGFFTKGAAREEAEALTDARLCIFFHDDLTRLMADYPDIAMRMVQNLGERLSLAERSLALSMFSVDVRLADYLLELPLLRDDSDPAEPANGPKVRLPLSKQDIASLLGTTPESLSRSLARLTTDNLIEVESDVVTLLDPQGLEDLVATA